MTQTLSILLDAYRELNSKKMFWIVLFLSGIVIVAFATVEIDAQGYSVLWFHFRSVFNTRFVSRESFFQIIFSSLGVGWWLNVIALVLALVSTAGIIPDFIAGGSVDLYLSKPMGRLRLFMTKFATGLVFVTLQVFIFTVGCYVLIGLRTHVWDRRMFLAVPVVVLVFSYLYAISALAGLLTRSPIAALLLTVLFWLTTFGVHLTEIGLLHATTAGDVEEVAYQRQFALLDKQVELAAARATPGDAAAQAELKNLERRRNELREKKSASDPNRRNFATGYAAAHAVQSILPKTAETSALVHRWLELDDRELNEEQLRQREERRAMRSGVGGFFGSFRDRTEVSWDDADVLRDVNERVNQRPAWWIIGSSVLFEAVVLGVASWIFCRRDF